MYKTIFTSYILLGSYFIYKSYKYSKVLEYLDEIILDEMN